MYSSKNILYSDQSLLRTLRTLTTMAQMSNCSTISNSSSTVHRIEYHTLAEKSSVVQGFRSVFTVTDGIAKKSALEKNMDGVPNEAYPNACLHCLQERCRPALIPSTSSIAIATNPAGDLFKTSQFERISSLSLVLC